MMIAALVLPVMMGFVGLALDVGVLMARRTDEQRAADSAALAGAYVLLNGGTTSDAKTGSIGAVQYAQKNGYGDGTSNCVSGGQICVAIPPTTGKHTCALDPTKCDNHVEVIISKTKPTFFIRVLGIENAEVQARAVAAVTPKQSDYALIVLNKTKCPAYNHSGSGDLLIYGGSAVINSDASVGSGGACPGEAANQSGGAIVTASNCVDSLGVATACSLDHVSGTDWDYPAGQATPAPTTISVPVSDPLGTLTRPMPCDKFGLPSLCITRSATSTGSAANPRQTLINSNTTLEPGTYYGGLKITGGDIVFAPGLYIFAGGEGNSSDKRGFEWRSTGTASVSGTSSEGVTFYNANYTAATSEHDRACGDFDITANGVLNLRAPADTGAKGPLDDNPVNSGDLTNGVETVLFWQADDCTEAFKYAGSTHTTAGIVYMPGANMNMSGGGNLGAMQVIVDTFDYTGSANTTITYHNYVDTVKPKVSLVE